MFKDELEFEKNVITVLQQYGWKDGVLYQPSEKDLLDNWRTILFNHNKQIDRLNNIPLTDTEMEQIIEQINRLRTPMNLNKFINGRTIGIVRDNKEDTLHFGKEINLKIYDKFEISAGETIYQIAEQPILKSTNPLANNRRGDIMLLINGMPLFHIELKRSNVPVSQATYQIEKYSYEGVYSGIYQLIQVFVAMTPEETLYFANPGQDGKFNQSFYFHWEDANNEIVSSWKEICANLLSIPMAHKLIGFYTIADDTDNCLKIMRSYQINAVDKISDTVAKIDWSYPDTRGGYIWHTTGSGKTMTSFKAAQIIAESKNADRVVFLMDRVELGVQSLSNYQGFANDKDDVVGTTNTEDLVRKLKEGNNVLIVTSIQKMSLIKNSYEEDIQKINRQRIVIIVDECHRDTFGLMMSSIKETLPKAVFFGFTGTPINEENTKNGNITSDIFGNELARYTIADGIRDGNVLGFDLYKVSTFADIDLKRAVALEKARSKTELEALNDPDKKEVYFKYMDNYSMEEIENLIPNSQYNSDNHRIQVVSNILENWNMISRGNIFSAILATNSIQEAIEYYRLFKENKNKLKITVLVDPNIDNKEGFSFKEDGLMEIYNDYNKMFFKDIQNKFTLRNSNEFKKDVSRRLAHKKPYERINENDKIDLLIVVDQMLTGFDSKWLNALYLDKVLTYENVIQAFSRTNRVYNQDKPFGIIKYYRRPYTMKKNIEDALKLYSGDKPFQLFVPKLEENVEKLNNTFTDIEKLFAEEGIENFSKIPEDKENQRRFVVLYNDLYKRLMSSMIQGFIPQNKSDEDTFIIKEEDEPYNSLEKNNLYLSQIYKEDLDALKQRYLEIAARQKNYLDGNPDLPFDIKSNIIETKDDPIDIAYMNDRFEKYLKVLSQKEYTEEELENALKNLHQAYSSLSKEQQKYADMLINDIHNGDIELDKSKTFIDYINEYAFKGKNDQIKRLATAFNLDENKLREMMNLYINEYNINELGRFDDLIATVDFNKSKETLEKLTNRELKMFEVKLEVRTILKKFILESGFDLNEYY